MIASINSNSCDGYGSELIRSSGCDFIKDLAEADFLKRCNDRNQLLQSWLSFVHSTLCRTEETLSNFAAITLESICKNSQEETTQELLDIYLRKIGPQEDTFSKRGFALAISKLPTGVLFQNEEKVVRGLIHACKIHEIERYNDVEYRRNSVNSLNDICKKLSESNLSHELFLEICKTFINGMSDYSVDARGDIGSWIREASIHGLITVLTMSKQHRFTLSNPMALEMFGLILFSCAEKIDRVRETAGKTITKLLSDSDIYIPERARLEIALRNDNDCFNWLNAKTVFPLIIRCLYIPCYRDFVLCGIMICIGGLTESIVRYSGETFIDFLSALPSSLFDGDDIQMNQGDIINSIHSLFVKYATIERVSVPIIDTLHLYINSGFMTCDLPEESVRAIFNLLKKEVFKSKNTKKLLSAIKV
jgi:hypothetical protein